MSGPCRGGLLALLLGTAVLGSGCPKQQPCVDPSKAALDQCSADRDKLQGEVTQLKTALAKALSNPGSIKIEEGVLVIEGQATKIGGIKVASPGKEGTLSQDQVIATLRQNKGGLQACYNRALKRNSGLHHRKIVITVGFQVKNSGNAGDISLRPNYDSEMTDCMQKAIRRWRFPAFKGNPVGVESPVTFQPRDK